MTVQLKKVDGGFQLVIPDDLAAQAGLVEGASVSVSVENGKVVAQAAGAPGYTLEQLLAGVTDENIHGEVDWGRPIGRERFWE